MRTVLLATLGLLAGCTELPLDGASASSTSGPCPLPAIDLSGTVTSVSAESLLVEARGELEGPVVLHIRPGETTLYLRDGLSCRPGIVSQVRPGETFEAVADGPVMESYPPQTTPSMVFIDRAE